MMKNILISLMMVSIGCASAPVKKQKSETEVLRERLAQAEKERQELREELELRTTQQQLGQVEAPAPQGPAGGYQPPAQPEGPMQQNWAWLVPPKGCGKPYLMEIQNNTDAYARASVDGVDLTIRGGRGMVPPLIRPHSSVYICLDDIGVHVFEAKLYAAHALTTGTRGTPPRELKAVGTCSYTGEYNYGSVQAYRGMQLMDFNWARSCKL